MTMSDHFGRLEPTANDCVLIGHGTLSRAAIFSGLFLSSCYRLKRSLTENTFEKKGIFLQPLLL